jgi:tRNA nucleotidyltransferase (CCA-adding enzyme)
MFALREGEERLAQASLRPSEAVVLLDAHPALAVEAFALIAERTRAAERARQYLDEWHALRPRLSGRDVQALGVPEGPRVGEALRALREARLDGRVCNREDEIALVRALARPLAETRRG